LTAEEEKKSKPEPAPRHTDNDLSDKIRRFIHELKQNTASLTDIDFDMYDIANQAFDAMQGTIAREKLAAYPPDFTIEVPRNACGTLEFDRSEEMIALGYERAQRALGELLQ